LAAIDSDFPTINKLKLSIGEDVIQAYIEGWIVNLIEFLNVGKNMNDNQVYETASFILGEYPILNIADINLIFKMAKMGKFGLVYDRLDGQVVLSWFDKYFTERCRAAAERSINESLKYKDNNVPSFDKITEMANKFKKY